MEINEKLTRSITETSYLNAPNTSRYRPIMRFFFQKYEKIEYWLYKEDVFNELKGSLGFEDYTLEQCESDLLALEDWKSLTVIQDTSNALTLQEFQNRRYRFRMTEYAVEIERLVRKLENMHIETASLEPKLFERIKIALEKISSLRDANIEDINEWWFNLNNDFTTLNRNYQDFLAKFNEAKTEELMKSSQFLLFKQDMIRYLKDFIKGFQINSYLIEESVNKIAEADMNIIMDKLIDYQKKVPRLVPDFNFDELRDVNVGKWHSISKWFIGDKKDESEASKLISATNNIINKITKYAASLIEIRGNTTNRKDEYRYIAELFGNMENIDDAHKLSSAIFGISCPKHFIGINKETDNIYEGVYNLNCTDIILKSRNRIIKEKDIKVPINDKYHEKEKQYNEYIKKIKHEKSILERHIQNGIIDLEKIGKVASFERRFILKLITKALNTKGKVKDSEYGVTYCLIKPLYNHRVTLNSDDGFLEMPAYMISFEGVKNE